MNKRRIFVSHGRLVNTEWRTPPRKRWGYSCQERCASLPLRQMGSLAERQLGKDEGQTAFLSFEDNGASDLKRPGVCCLNVCRSASLTFIRLQVLTNVDVIPSHLLHLPPPKHTADCNKLPFCLKSKGDSLPLHDRSGREGMAQRELG